MSKKPEAKKDAGSKKEAAPKAAAPASKKEEPKAATPKEQPKAAAPAKKEEPKAAAKPAAAAAKKEEPKAAAKPAAKQGSESAAKPAAKKQGSESAAKPADKKVAAKPTAAATKPAAKVTSKTAAPTKAAPVKAAAVAAGHVPENVQKKLATQAKITASRLISKAAKKSAGVKARRDIFRRAEKYAKEYRTQERELIRFKRQAKNAGNYYRPAEAKVMLVVRIRGINRIAPKSVKILHLLRLRQIHNAVFLKVNKATMNMLRVIEPYVTYGPPTQKTVAALLYKRGHGKVNKQRIKLDQNTIIEKALGKHGIICIEDLIHEIYTCGPHFKEANNFLWPFKLSSPLGGLSEKRRHYSEGGQHGNREEDINKLVKLMN